MPLDTASDLRDHLELAIEVELSTIPLYLYAYYSIEDPGTEAARLIRSVVAEEMLHVALASNLLLSIGGSPDFRSRSMVPTYPTLMQHHEPPLRLDLRPCTVDLVRDVFMAIERPEVHGAPPEPDQYETLGQFYHALELAFERLDSATDLFAEPQANRQMADPAYYSAVEFDADDSGGLVLVDGLAAARAAIEIIVHQGEGLSEDRWADPEHRELTHFHKYKLIADGSVPLPAVAATPTNPATADYPARLQPVSNLFNALYRSAFFVMDEVLSTHPDKHARVKRLYHTMSTLMHRVARYLVTQPLGNGFVAAPTFECYEFATTDVRGEVAALARRVGADHPELADVAGLIPSAG